YKAFLIDADSYLLEVSRYLHLNPIRTERLSVAPREARRSYLRRYPWSSYPDYISPVSRYAPLTLDAVLGRFNGSSAAYRRFVEAGISVSQNPLEKGKGHGIVGDPSFIRARLAQIKAPKPTREQPPARRIAS